MSESEELKIDALTINSDLSRLRAKSMKRREPGADGVDNDVTAVAAPVGKNLDTILHAGDTCADMDESMVKYIRDTLKLDPANLDMIKGEDAKIDVKGVKIVCEAEKKQLVYTMEELKTETIVLKEGTELDVHLMFKVDNDIIPCLTYASNLKTNTKLFKIEVGDTITRLGSFAPFKNVQEKNMGSMDVPKLGPLSTLKCHMNCLLTDDRNQELAKLAMQIKIKKAWNDKVQEYVPK